MRRFSLLGTLSLLVLLTSPGTVRASCPEIRRFLADKAADVVCFASPDLTTNNATSPPTGPTTPSDNSLPGLPPFAFTPTTDRAIVSPDPPDRTPITKAVPGIQVEGRFRDDPTGEARFLLRFPGDWNGRLVVAGSSGTRSEFNGDFAFSDYVVQKGYAYASQNKGVLNLYVTTESDPLGCRLNPNSTTFVHFYANDPDKPFTQWTEFIIRTGRLARDATNVQYRHSPRRIYVIGASNGGYQVRRAIEAAPDLFDGGVDWEGTLAGPNVLIDLPVMLKYFPDYVASNFDADSVAAKAIRAAGYPPDLVNGLLSFWGLHYAAFYEVTMCQWQKRFDPTYDTYGAGLVNYDYTERAAITDVAERLAKVEPTGIVKKPLITVAGTMDALLPIKRHARVYEARVHSSRRGRDQHDDARGGHNEDDGSQDGDDGHRTRPYRLYEIQNGNHVETYRNSFRQLEFIMPHAQHAFDLLVDHVEHGAALPPDQCVPRGGSITAAPREPAHCAELLVP